jgi:uncharacterized protein YjbI with pentapeptide repeats
MEIINNISIFKLIKENETLENFHVVGDVSFYKINLENKLAFINCKFDSLSLSGCDFDFEIKFINCKFKKVDMVGTFFHGGVLFSGCTFYSHFLSDSGIHNKKPYLLQGNVFHEFADFTDCWFMGEVIIKDNAFIKGTNLLGNKDEMFRVQFDSGYIIENNTGQIDVDGFGDTPVNVIVGTK